MNIESRIADELGVRLAQVESAIGLLDEGATVPFISRYRKEATGGLDDTVIPFDPDKGSGNGFKFGPFEADAFLEAIRRSVDVFKRPRSWKILVTNGMKMDFSWDRSAEKYVALYQSILQRESP